MSNASDEVERRAAQVIRDGEKQLSSGETERLVAEARRTKGAALANGQHDIAQAAQAVIDDLGAEHAKAHHAHTDLIEKAAKLDEANANVAEANADLDEAKAKLDQAKAKLDEAKRRVEDEGSGPNI